jgi:hypothetical protein
MERFIQLNLKSDSDKPENTNPPQAQQGNEPEVSSKKLNAIANRALHRVSGHGGSGGIFSK